MLAASAERILSGFDDSAVVLDIGGWADPFSRADWVMDLMPYETRGLYEREGWIEPRGAEPERFDTSTWIQRDICERTPYPFGNDELDFVVCSQTLEDVRDPVWVCAEMNRIGRAGYIEVPSRLDEQSFGIQGSFVGWPHHHWLIDIGEASIEFVMKSHEIHGSPDLHFPAGFRDQLSSEERVQALWWEGGFTYRERVFFNKEDVTSYLGDFVARELTKRSLPVRAPSDSRVRRQLRRLGRLRPGK
jgi:hypothetical protein